MRCLVIALVVLATASAAPADVARIVSGDLPRTGNHFLNAREAALCRANAAAGGAASYFLNPAAISEEEGVAGQATIRMNVTTRDYLPDGDEFLDSSGDGLLFSQAVAVKKSANWSFGFGYSCPSYRSLELTGRRLEGEELKQYEGDFSGSLRHFDVLLATQIGSEGQGAIGVALGVANMAESAREVYVGESLTSSDLSGMGFSSAVGMSYKANERLSFGLGYRRSTTVKLRGDWYQQDVDSAESTAAPSYVFGLRAEPFDGVRVFGSYVREAWDKAEAEVATYPDDDGKRSEFGTPLSTVAVGLEADLFGERGTVRAGCSMTVGSDIDSSIVPEYSIGLGGTLALTAYYFDAALVHEVFAVDGESGETTNLGLYLTVGYVFF